MDLDSGIAYSASYRTSSVRELQTKPKQYLSRKVEIYARTTQPERLPLPGEHTPNLLLARIFLSLCITWGVRA